MEWIELFDTTIKIGLGALIAGIAGYKANLANHKHEEKRVYIQKRREYLDKVIEIVNDFHKNYVAYRAKVHDAVNRRDSKIEDSGEQKSELDKLHMAYSASFERFVDAEGYILAINEKDLHKAMYSYMELVLSSGDEMWHENNKQLTSERVDELNNTIRAERKEFLLKLSKAYQ